ncbi:MAG: hypothetical protein WC659_05510 [Patescibacteria group bacterium]
MSKLLKSVWYGIVSFLPSFFMGLLIFSLLSTLAFIALSEGITTAKFYREIVLLNSIFSIVNRYLIAYIVAIIAIVIISCVLFIVTFIKILNPSFNASNLGDRRLSIRILISFASWLISISLINNLLRGLLLALIPLRLNLLTTILLLIIDGFLWSLLILFWRSDGYYGNLKNFRELSKGLFKEKIKNIYRTILTLSAGRGRIVAKVFCVLLIGILADTFSESLIYNGLGLASVGGGPEVLWGSHFVSFINIVFGFSLGSFVFLPLVYTFLQNEKSSKREIFAKLIPVLVVLAAIGYGYGYNAHYIKNLDYKKEFINEVGITGAENKTYNSLVYFDNGIKVKTPEAFAYYYPHYAGDDTKTSNASLFELYNLTSSFSDEEGTEAINVICNPGTIDKIKSIEPYLAAKGYQSLLSLDYFTLLGRCYELNWDIDNFIRTKKLSFETTNALIDGLVYIGPRSMVAQYDKSAIDDFKKFLDTDKYHIGNNARSKIAQKFSYYDERAEAEKWATGDELNGIKWNKFKGGVIKGQVFVNGAVNRNIKVGLLVDKEKKYGIYLGDIPEKRLVAAAGIDENGDFTFHQIMEDEYELAFLILGENLKENEVSIESTNALNNLKVDLQHSVYDMGAMNILW